MNNPSFQRVAPWLFPIGVLALWQVSSQAGWLSTRMLPEPWAVRWHPGYQGAQA